MATSGRPVIRSPSACGSLVQASARRYGEVAAVTGNIEGFPLFVLLQLSLILIELAD
jgi:hypothetical protein